MAVRLAKFVLKSAAAGGLVYVTLKVTNSVWFDPRHAVAAREVDTAYIPALFARGEEARPEIFKEVWNFGVQKVFHGLLVAPDTVKELSDKAVLHLKNSYKKHN